MTRRLNPIRDLTEGNLTRQMLAFSIPFMVMNLLQALYNVVDLIVVGRFVGSAGLSAVSMGGLLTEIMLQFGIGIATGGQIYIAQMVGAKRKDKLCPAIMTSFFVIFVAAVIVGTAGCCLDRVFLRWINIPAEAMEYAHGYVFCCSAGIIFLYGYNAVCAVLRGMGNSTMPMLFAAVATVVNVGLDLLFVGVFHWAARGAALATVIAQGVSFFAAVVYLFRVRQTIGLEFSRGMAVFDGEMCRTIIKLGLPMTFMQIAVKGSMMYINSFINAYGVVTSVVVGVGDKLYSVINIVTAAIMASVSAVTAQNMGAAKPERAKQSVILGWKIGCGFVFLVSVLVLAIPQTIFGIFSDDREVIALAPTYLGISLIMYWGFALRCPPSGLIIGVGNTSLNFVIGLIDAVVARIGLSLLLGIVFRMGFWGFVLGNALAGMVSVLLCMCYFFSGRWKTRRVIQEKAAAA